MSKRDYSGTGYQNPLGASAPSWAGLPPETTSKLVGAATPLALAGGLAGAGALLSARQQSGYSLPVQPTTVQARQPAFATQQYIPGVSPLTNEQAGALYLEQVRMQNQMQLIQARQMASSPQSYYSELGDISSGLSGAYTRKYI